MRSLQCLFIVQGEGRGHMTQALALRQMLVRAGHRVVGVIIGQRAEHTAPSFFHDEMEAPITYISSPHFVADELRRGVRVGASLWKGLHQADTWQRSLTAIRTHLQRHRPDVVVNFFEPMAGLYWGWNRPEVPMVAVAHQYMFHHPVYRFPAGHRIRRWSTQAFSWLTGWGAARRLALSLYPARDCPDDRLFVMPPLLRPALFDLPEDRTEPFLLLYVLNSGYADEIIQWHRRRPEVRLHCFWDRPDAEAVEHYDDTLTFHQLDSKKFLALMARCRGVATTAGFESVAEAMVLGKPVQVVPVEGHFEQRCNAHDTVRAGGGVWSERFDLDRLIDALPRYEPPGERFRTWVQSGEDQVVQAVEACARRKTEGTASAAAEPPVRPSETVPSP